MSAVELILTLDSLLACIWGLLVYLAPHYFADLIFQRSSDGVHWHLLRCVGGQIFASALVSYSFRKSSAVAQSVCHFIRIIPTIFLLGLSYQCQSVTPDLIPITAVKSVRYILFATLFLHLGLLFKNGWQTGSQLVAENKIGNLLYQLDSLASICIGTAWMTFPKWLLHRQVLVELDESHEMLGRVMGANFIASYIVSTHALYWESQADRYVAVDCRVLCCLSILGAQIWSQTYEHWSGNHWIGITLFSTWTASSLIYRFFISMAKSKKSRKD